MSDSFRSLLAYELERTVYKLRSAAITEEEHAQLFEKALSLHEMLESTKKHYVNREALINAGAQLIGILLIINHERVNVITTRALSFVPRLR